MTTRILKYSAAIQEALELCMERDPNVYIMGLGVPDPKGIFNTTDRLLPRFGPSRVLDIPCAENGVTGIAIGSALTGLRPVLTHQRVDFALLSMEQIVNQAAKWHYMFGGRMRVPLVIRMVIGRGWGQGPQHSQNLHAWFAHIPGLKVVLPATPADAKGLLISSIEDDGPVVFLEHRWLHGMQGPVPEGHYRVPIGEPRVMRPGTDLTIVAVSYMTVEAVRAAEYLESVGISAEVIDLRSVNPLDDRLILESVRKTGRLIVADTGTKHGGFSGEIVSRASEAMGNAWRSAPVRIACPDSPTPTSPALANLYYPRFNDLVAAAYRVLGRPVPAAVADLHPSGKLDIPDPTFTGPF